LAGQSTALQTNASKQSFDASDMSDSFEKAPKSTIKKPLKTLSLKSKTLNYKQA